VLARELDNMETRSRRKILLVHGVAEQEDEETVEVVWHTFKTKLSMASLAVNDILRCHRMGRHKPDAKPRPILVELITIKLRDNIWSSKTKFKGTGITVSEFLTRSRHTTFMAARERHGVTRCWTREGSVFVISADGSRHRIDSIDDLNKIKDIALKTRNTTKPAPPRQKRAAASKN